MIDEGHGPSGATRLPTRRPDRPPIRLQGSSAGTYLRVAAGTALAVIAGVAVGYVTASGGVDPKLFVMIIGALAGIGFILLAISRAELFILILLAIRPLLDGFHLAGGDGAFNPSTIVGLVFLVCTTSWLVVESRQGRLARPSVAVLGMVALWTAAVLSSVVSRFPLASAVATLRYTTALVMLIAVEHLLRRTPELITALDKALIAASLSVNAWAFFEIGTRQARVDIETGVMRAQGPFVHPNVLAKFAMIMTLYFAARMLARAATRRVRLTMGILAALALLTTFLSMARFAWITLMVGLGYLLWRRDRRLIPPLIIVAVLAVMTIPALTQRIADLWAPPAAAGVPENSMAWRFGYWERLIELGRLNPINGTGFSTIPIMGGEGLAAHNVWVQARVELGWVGVMGLLAFLGGFAWHLWVSRNPSPQYTAAVAIAITMLITTVTENLIDETTTLWYAAVTIAIGCAAARPTPGPGTGFGWKAEAGSGSVDHDRGDTPAEMSSYQSSSRSIAASAAKDRSTRSRPR